MCVQNVCTSIHHKFPGFENVYQENVCTNLCINVCAISVQIFVQIFVQTCRLHMPVTTFDTHFSKRFFNTNIEFK